MKPSVPLALGLLLALSPLLSLQAQENAPESLDHGRWLGSMGAAGLRRSVANGSDLGDLVNRVTSSKVAAQVASRANPGAGDFDSESGGWVVQQDSFLPLTANVGGNLLFRGAMRRAQRYEDGRVDARADRVELGLFQASRSGYLGLNLELEQTRAELGFVKGHRDAEGLGLRADMGRVLNARWAVSSRLEHVWWEGDGLTYIPSAAGTLRVSQDSAFQRSYANLEVIARFPVDRPYAGLLHWRSGIHYLRNANERMINSLGQPVQEPFGPYERLGLLRSGISYAWRFGQRQQWSPYLELIYDYEFENNMDAVIDDAHTVALKAGLARLIKAGWRAQLDVQRYQGLAGERRRDSATLALVIDL